MTPNTRTLKGQSHCSQRGPSCLAKGGKVAWLFQFPLLKEMLRMEKLCYVTGFTKGMVDSLLYKKEALRCSGKIYSEEYRQRFETKNVIFKIERSPIDQNKLMLTINQQPISEWFKEQWEKLQQHLRNSVQKEQKSRGFRM